MGQRNSAVPGPRNPRTTHAPGPMDQPGHRRRLSGRAHLDRGPPAPLVRGLLPAPRPATSGSCGPATRTTSKPTSGMPSKPPCATTHSEKPSLTPKSSSTEPCPEYRARQYPDCKANHPDYAMTPPQISQFLQDSIIRDDTNDSALDADVFYGLYVSWCSLNRKVPLEQEVTARPTGMTDRRCSTRCVPRPGWPRDIRRGFVGGSSSGAYLPGGNGRRLEALDRHPHAQRQLPNEDRQGCESRPQRDPLVDTEHR